MKYRKDGHPHEAWRFAGYRAMQSLCATRPEWQGVAGDLGMYLFSHAVWLADEMRRGAFDRIAFLARDGKLVKAAFDEVNAALRIPVATDYVRISRQAALPLQFIRAEDFASLPEAVPLAAHTPRTLLKLLAPVIDIPSAEAAMAEAGLPLDALLNDATIPRLIAAFQRRVFDPDRFRQYREYARNYLAPRFTGRCATFDVGYNLRSESVIRAVTGADLTAFITHTDSDLPDRRGVPYRTLYPVSPYVSWVAREQFLLTADDPPCLRYGAEGPACGDAPELPQAIQTVQREATAFVREMVRLHGAGLAQLPFRPVDGCLAFERFLHGARRREMLPFRNAQVENAFHDGAAEGDGPFLQWRLMQTDALPVPPAWRKIRRALIRLREEPRNFVRKARFFRK